MSPNTATNDEVDRLVSWCESNTFQLNASKNREMNVDFNLGWKNTDAVVKTRFNKGYSTCAN